MPGSDDAMSISLKPALTDRLFRPGRSTGRLARRRAALPWLGSVEGLEPRWLPSVATPAIEMLSATTTDSKSVTIEYQVNQAPTAATPLQFGVYRSSDGQFDSSDAQVDTFTLVSPGASSGQATPTLDSSGQSATAVGTHQLTIPLPQGLPPYPEKPYVLVVADPGSPSATTEADQTASFRVYTIGVVTHGGIQDPSWIHGPPWVLETAYMMRHEGFDSAFAYNWALQSSTPGEAIKQSPRLAKDILHAASKFPASAVVDLELVGHSEGTVVNTYALVKVASEMPANLKAGYIEDTLLDPHAANNDIVSGKQMSFNGVLAPLANVIVTDYQGEAKDPPPYFPSVVDQANVFFEHTSSTPGQIYNLWGQVPVKSDGPVVHYYNLTGMGVTHSGKTGVSYWYRDFIAPNLGVGAPLIPELQLNGQIDDAQTPAATASAGREAVVHQANLARANHIYGPEHVVASNQPEFSGTAAPNSIVRLFLSPATKPQDIAPAGITHANSSGEWTVTTRRPIPNGQYRTVVTAFSRALRTRPGLAIVPTQPLGRLVVDGSSGT
jgi:Bacterial Ig-like domain